MKSLAFAVMLLGTVAAAPAVAQKDDDDDDKSVPQEARTKIEQVLASIGCQLGDIEFENSGYEIDDANCADGRTELELDKEFKVTSRERDDEGQEGEDDDDRQREDDDDRQGDDDDERQRDDDDGREQTR
jgi:hypothetical protein